MLVPHGTHVMVMDGSRIALFRNRGRDAAPKPELGGIDKDYAGRAGEKVAAMLAKHEP